LEQVNLASNINFEIGYKEHPPITIGGATRQISSFRIPTYLCPSEINDRRRGEGTAEENYPLNYGWNAGVWFNYDPVSVTHGPGTLLANRSLRLAEIKDGTSNTLLFAEVKAYNPYFRNADLPAPLPQPAEPADVVALGGTFKTNSGHTEWVDGRVHQSGFTTTFTPNTNVLYTDSSGELFDVDWNNHQTGKNGLTDTVSTYAAVTSRSYHSGGVNICRADGSVSFVSDNIDRAIWQAVGTRNGGEVIESMD